MIDFDKLPMLAEDDSENIVVPNYVKIYDIIFHLIDEGVLNKGDAIPSENTLANYWNVSRGTVRMAMRKLEEDGYITKTQGKQAVVATFALQTKEGFHWLYNTCMDNCLDIINEVKVESIYQPCGVYVAHELGYDKPGFLVLSVNTNYYSETCHVANSIMIFDAKYVDEFKLDITNEERMKQFIVKDIYHHAKRSKTVFNVLSADDDTVIDNMDSGEPIVIVEEILMDENDNQLAYCKHRLNGSKYRFSMERKTQI